jgi:glycosyltransferase involved in cell wall biosynthesis
MKVNVVHTDLNPCGGAEQLSVATLQALVEIGMDVDLTVAREPDVSRIRKAFGDRAGDVFERVKVRLLGRLPVELDETGALVPAAKHDMDEYGLVVNTHGDILPYFEPSFSGRMITYCHFPVAAHYYIQRNVEYLQNFAALGLLDDRMVQDGDKLWKGFFDYYLLMLKNSLVATNSQYSRQAIIEVMKSAGEQADPVVIAPPVCVEDFRKAALFSSQRSDSVLVVSRIHPTKKLENTIRLARLLKQQGLGKEVVIAGNLSLDDRAGSQYHDYLLEMAECCGVSGYVKIKLNVGLQELWSLMAQSKAYFHPLPGEPFGISVAEAMSAGLVPVVPAAGGPAGFVPRQYQFSTLEEAAGIVRASFAAPTRTRLLLSDSVRGFSLQAYLRNFQKLVRHAIEPAGPEPALATPYKKTSSHAMHTESL